MERYFETLEKIFNLRGGIIDLRLDRMRQALALFNHPENQFPSLHIAGTNGKGSTAALLHNILQQAGYRTALYTSPHLESFTERIRIGHEEIAQAEVVSFADEIWQRTAEANVPLTFFEFITVMAFIYFARNRVDVAVVEVGLGGRLDATNVVSPLVSVITTIAKDHEAYLGPDELSIAREKGGIIKPRIPVICGKVSEPVTEVLQEIARLRESPAYFLGTSFSFLLKNERLFDYIGIKQNLSGLALALRGRHQLANASLALAALELVNEHFPVPQAALRYGLETVRWPGRLEVISERPLVILDGAHNPEGVRALADALIELRQGRKIKLLFATMADKEWQLMLEILAKLADEIIFTRVSMERSADPELLAKNIPVPIPSRVIQDSQTALAALLDRAQPDDILVVAGSLYLLGEVRPRLSKSFSSGDAVSPA
ncbi:MAG TPA: folylpolyglutamate synthase/dihydrofolate synthase family protein [Candidatus Eisenbacteria bacterium]|nr:folylpolyglutamate synthase/dihydrofolate synthase family protein [Candidatus Eisenbacteria bacterium]